jgi:hypothetical protein
LQNLGTAQDTQHGVPLPARRHAPLPTRSRDRSNCRSLRARGSSALNVIHPDTSVGSDKPYGTSQGTLGRGNVNLDQSSCDGLFDRNVRDSGAIIVGAGDPSTRSRLGFSSYGSRVDVQGWGRSVTTTGYGWAFDPGDIRQRYTHDFSGTSSASPIVAGAVLGIQGALKARGEAVATPLEIRDALVATGTPQNGTDQIGPLPDIKAALDWILDRRIPVQWSGWRSAGGATSGFVDCQISGSRIECFGRSTSNRLVWNRGNLGSTPVLQTSWTDLGGTISAPPSCVVRGSRIDCFAYNAGTKTLAQRSFNGTSWGSWTSRGGSLSGRASCLSPDGTSIHCFARGSTGALQWLRFDGSAWRAWANLGGAIQGGYPECVARSNGIDCVVWSSTNRMHHRRWQSGAWSSWADLGGSVGASPSCAISSNGTWLHCFVRTTSNKLAQRAHSGTSWQAWQDFGGSLTINPNCINTGSNNLSCFARFSDKVVYQRARVGGTWQPWQSIGKRLMETRPTCLPSSGARIDCVTGGASGIVYHNVYK